MTDEPCSDLCFRKAFEAAAVGIALCNLDGQILKTNPAFERIVGGDHGKLAQIDQGLLDRGSQFSELIRGKREFVVIQKHYHRPDGTAFWGKFTVSIVHSNDRNPSFLVGILEDKTEARQVEEQLRQTETMALIGRLAGGVAHDFNNLLTGILLYCDLLRPELAVEDRFRHYVEELRAAAEQGAHLTQQLLTVARKQAPNAGSLEVNAVITSTEKLLRLLTGAQIELMLALDPDARMVRADAVQLRQILLNLALNARDAIVRARVEGGRIRISTEPAELRRQRNLPREELQEAVALVVEDNGCGMNAETRAHLFEFLFTTKKTGEGTGMGLAMVQRIVGELGGAIEVASEPGRGTRVEVLLPTADPPARTDDGHVSRTQNPETSTCKGDSLC